VLVGTKKLAGVLMESELTEDQQPCVLVGAGINVNFDPHEHEEIRDIATSIRAETGRAGDREALLAAYLLHAEQIYFAAKSGESPFERWRERLATLGQPVRATWSGGVTDGVAEDVKDDGALVIRTADGRAITVQAGDVTLRV
jgi:BirA family biotin operon repressor/biotin-[acetyl-CoA-carboxylase] ligase